jgi:alkanesulfonate monooxygenase
VSVDFIGMVVSTNYSETRPAIGPAIDPAFLDRHARAHEEAGFDRILIDKSSSGPDTFLVASRIAAVTSNLHLMLAHRPGFTAPTLAARQFATLDHLSGGRAAIHVISGGNDREQRRDGDFLSHDERYQRTDEYLGILRRVWSSEKPIDHEGRFYRFSEAFADVKPLQKPYIPIFFGGASEAAIKVAVRHADIYALWGESLDQVRDLTGRVRAAFAAEGRPVRFSLSVRPILATTEKAAWQRAEGIRDRVKQLIAQGQIGKPNLRPENTGSQRLLQAAARAPVLDKRLWTEIAGLTGAPGNSTALVGTPEQVAEALLDYYDLGITTFLIRGFDPLEDTEDYGRELIPLVRAEVARRAGAAAAE